MDPDLLAFRAKYGISTNDYELTPRKNSITDSGLDSADSYASVELEDQHSQVKFQTLDLGENEQAGNTPRHLDQSDLISETSSDKNCRNYAKSMSRNLSRKSMNASLDDDIDENLLIQLALLLDTTKGLPCKTKKGKISKTNEFELNYRDRKRMSLINEVSNELTPEQAMNLLNCKYLRLTESNIESLEKLCEKGGYDVSFHPHKEIDVEDILKN